MFKKLLLPLPVILILLVGSIAIMSIYYNDYHNKNKEKITQENVSCTVASVEMKDSTIHMKLICNGKEYKTRDNKLIYAHMNNKPIIGNIQADGYVVSIEDEKKP